MRLKLLFFASLREALQTADETLETDAVTVQAVREQLAGRGGEWTRLTAKHIRAAVNQDMADDACVLKDGDELAFFPPVTGG